MLPVKQGLIQPPYGFHCNYSLTIMQNPYLGECGHLFDASVINTNKACPNDGMPLVDENCLAIPQLAERINRWQLEHLPPPEPTPKPSMAQKLQKLHPSDKPTAAALPSLGPSHTLKDAHTDDIHGLIKIAPGVFVSGSKDNAVKLWDVKEKTPTTLRPRYVTRGYEHWVTALCKISDTKFAHGTRSGYVSIWNMEGKELNSFKYTPSACSRDELFCKDRNKERITCISPNTFDDQDCFFTGTPRYIQLWDSNTKKMLEYWETDKNDWVYCIEPLSRDTMIRVIGSRLELWSNIYDKSPNIAPLINEKKEYNQMRQRSFISAIVRLDSNRDLMPCALFDGSVRIVNIVSQTVLRVYKEHEKRVWSVIELQPNIVASSADDKTIKLWDLRAPSSILTIGGNPGRVSSLLKIDDNQFISGSCPDNVYESKEKASICFWDIRNVMSHTAQKK